MIALICWGIASLLFFSPRMRIFFYKIYQNLLTNPKGRLVK